MAEKKAVKKNTTAVHDAVVEPVKEAVERYPRFAQTANFRVEVVQPVTSGPQARIAPVGWVGPVPLTIPEDRIDELIEVLGKVR